MDSLEIQLRRCTRSWVAWSGALGASLALFFGIASTGVIPDRLEPPELPPLTLSFAATSSEPVEHPPAPPTRIPANLTEAFKFDPTTSDKPPEIPLGLLDTSAFGNSFSFFGENSTAGFDVRSGGAAGFTAALELQRTFEAQKPEHANPFIIFERDQVDEIPVWLYGPQPNVPDRYDSQDWNVIVFYTVSERGKTENILALDATDPSLIEPVKRAITEWKFRAARKNGKPVKMWVQQAVNHTQEFKSPFTL